MEATVREGLKLPVTVLLPFSAIKHWAAQIMMAEVQQELHRVGGGQRVTPATDIPPQS